MIRSLAASLKEFQDRIDTSKLQDRHKFGEYKTLVKKIIPMLLRGVITYLRVGSASGVPLVGRGVRILSPQKIFLGSGVVVEDYAEIQGTSVRGIHLSDHVTIGRSVQIRPSSYYSGPIGAGLNVGSHSSIGPNSYIGCSGAIHIGNCVMIAPGVGLFAENHNFNQIDKSIKSQGVVHLPISIEDDCWIASGVIIIGGVTIGRSSVIGAGSVVTEDIPAFSVAVGSPARVIRSR